MRLEHSMGLRMGHELHLAPRMIQSMEILQLPIMALEEKIQQELQENPVLELTQDSENANPNDDWNDDQNEYEFEPNTSKDTSDKTLVIDTKGQAEADFERLDGMPEEWKESLYDDHRPSRNAIEEFSERKHNAMQNMVSRPQSLEDYLIDQLSFFDISKEERRLVNLVIANLDDGGYLKSSAEEIANSIDPPCTPDQIRQAISIVQRLDPPGICARDLAECLLLQLTSETPNPDAVKSLITNHLENIRHNRIPAIQKTTGLDLNQIKEAIEVIRKLNPKPAAIFNSENIPYVVPDIEIFKSEDGEYLVRLADELLPNVQINQTYVAECKNRATDKKVKEFLRPKIQSAQWLLEAIEQRRSTLKKVTQAIIQRQLSFLELGPEHIEPLKMLQIAEVVGVDVSTISRAVDDKWVQTPRGVFPLKRFFGGGTQSATGEDIAWEKIRRKLLEVVGVEDKSNPLSDEDLVNKLQEEGYPVARRTITKYRKILNIPSSRERKNWTP
jgi:RNA polymerase sigma-54 factor